LTYSVAMNKNLLSSNHGPSSSTAAASTTQPGIQLYFSKNSKLIFYQLIFCHLGRSRNTKATRIVTLWCLI